IQTGFRDENAYGTLRHFSSSLLYIKTNLIGKKQGRSIFHNALPPPVLQNTQSLNIIHAILKMKALISPEPAVLGFMLKRPLHGYELYAQINEQLGLVWRVGQSQLYAILKSYVERGWI